MKSVFPILLVFLLSCLQKPEENKLTPEIRVEKAKQTCTYDEAKHQVDSARKNLGRLFIKADTLARRLILTVAGRLLHKIVANDFYSYWRGTPWDFNGISRTPKTGAIACGYFVTGLLKDAGVGLNRVKLSTCPSLVMMQSLTSRDAVHNYSGLAYDEFVKSIKSEVPSLYVVGLDYHTGFIATDGVDAWFIHSNYILKAGVMKEKLSESLALRASKTRYVVSLTSNEKFLRQWITTE